jgi:formylglycine-generating enzyme required for sulfatase activity
VNHGSTSNITVTPAVGWHFVSVIDSEEGSKPASYTTTPVTGNRTVTTTFAINTYTLTYTAGTNGTISGTSPQTVNYGGSGTTVTAVPDAGYHFVQWSDGVQTVSRTDTSVTADISITATFTINQYTLIYTAGTNGTISGTSHQTVNYGGSGTKVTAVPNSGYAFLQWSDGVQTSSRTDINVTANISVTASFVLLPPIVTSFTVNGGAATTMPLAVTLENTATSSPTDYMASESASFTGASWETYGSAPSFTLSFGVGTRTVYFKARNGAGESDVVNDTIFLVPNMLSVAAGTFTMGRTALGDDETYGYTIEDPQHEVMLGGYQLGKGEVTNKEYCDVLNWAGAQGHLCSDAAGTPWAGSGSIYAGNAAGAVYLIVSFESTECNIQYSGGTFSSKTRVGLPGATNYSMDTHPMVCVSWYGSVVFCDWLSQWQGLTPCYDMAAALWPLTVPPPTSAGYRLPTEAEWERAAAWDGSKHWIYGFTSDMLIGKNWANYWDFDPNAINPLGLTAYPYTTPVAWFDGVNVSPNGDVMTSNAVSPVGAYDMCGNVYEWCHDWYVNYNENPVTNPTGPATGSNRIVRGGGWNAFFYNCRSAFRYSFYPTTTYSVVGFRLAHTTQVMHSVPFQMTVVE